SNVVVDPVATKRVHSIHPQSQILKDLQSPVQTRSTMQNSKFESLARFDKWKASSKNLTKLINSSMTTRTKLGLRFKEYFGSDEVFDLSTPSIFDPKPVTREVKSLYERFVKAGDMHEVPPSITRTFMLTSSHSVLEETQVTFGSKSLTSINTSDSNDFVSCDNSDKSSESETHDFASCVSSPMPVDSFSTVDIQILPKSDVKDPSPTNGVSSCSIKENVKPPSDLCNKRRIVGRNNCNNNFVRTKTCFVYGSKSHLIKDCHVYDTVDNFPSVVLKAASVPAGSRNSSAFTSTDLTCNRVPRAMVHPHVNKDIGIVDSGCSRSMTGNKDKLDDFVQVKGGTVTFGGGDGKITGKGTIRTSKLNFENVYYVEGLQNFNLFSVSQICDKKNKVLFTDNECLVFSIEFQLPDESQVVLRIPRRHDLYTFNLSDIQPKQHINCLLAKASLEESTKWHKRIAHANFKTINKLAKLRLVEGLPLKLFTNDHNYVACNKGKQHKDSYKAVSADFISLIENQLNKKVKAIKCDNGIEFWNAKLIALCEEKGIKRDYSNANTPQQNRVAERKNRTLIEAERSMVSITNPHNKTPYELLSGKIPNIHHLKPFGCQVTILNASDNLGKFEGKANDGFLVGYAAHSKAYRVYNLSSKKVEETLNLRYLQDKPNVQGLGQEWYFDLDYLTYSLGYTRFKTSPPAGPDDTNILAGIQADDSDSECDEHVILVLSFPSNSFLGPTVQDVSAPIENNLDYAEELARLQRQEYEAHSTNLVPAAGDPAGGIVPTGGVPAGSDPASGIVPTGGVPAGSDPASSSLAGCSIPASSVPTSGDLAGSTVPASDVPAGSFLARSVSAGGVLAGSPVSTDSGASSVPVASVLVSAVVSTDSIATSPLPPIHSLGSCAHTIRFPSLSDLGNHQHTAGIFSSSSYDD
nr:hypothetical protein [Tanacetum cinerariifolium]